MMLRTHSTTVVTLFFCCLLIVHADERPSEEPSDNAEAAVQNTAKIASQNLTNNRFVSFVKDKFAALMRITNPDVDDEGDAENERAFDLSFNGNKTTQNVSFITTVPINPVDGYTSRCRKLRFLNSLKT